MKKCPLCGKIYEDEVKCPSCGIFLIDTETNQAVAPENGKHKHIVFGRNKSSESADKSEQDSSSGMGEQAEDAISRALMGIGPDEKKNTDREEKKQEEIPDGSEEKPDEKPETQKQREQELLEESIFGKAKPVKQEKANYEKKTHRDVTITVNPILIGAAVILVLVIIAVVFFVRGMKKDQVSAPQTVDSSSYDSYEQQDSSDEQEPDLSDVTLNAYDSDYVVVSGHPEDNYGSQTFVFDDFQNIYLFDKYTQKEDVVDNVTEISLDPDASLSLSDYAGREMRVQGTLWKEGDNIVFSPQNLEYVEPEQDNAGIHRYEIVTGDCTWKEAFDESKARGGYLARISSLEEYQYIVNMLNEGDYSRYHFYLGGRRDDSGSEYYWIDKQDEFMGDCLNSSSSWCSSYWYKNEPSFYDTGSEANGHIEENVMNLFCVSGTWYLNDSSSDLPGNYPDLLGGKVGYIIEYEE